MAAAIDLDRFRHYYGKMPSSSRLQFADPHMHTNEIDGKFRPAELVEEAMKHGLAMVGVVSHDSTRDSIRARAIAANNRYPLEVPISAEISSRHGHILGIGISESGVPAGLSAERTIAEIHRQGGIAIVAHPGLRYVNSLSLRQVRALTQGSEEVMPDGVELLSGGTQTITRTAVGRFLYGPDSDKIATSVFSRDSMPGAAIGGTDGHRRRIALVKTGYPEGVSFVDAVKRRETFIVYDMRLEDPAFTRKELVHMVPSALWFGVDRARATIIDLYSRARSDHSAQHGDNVRGKAVV